MYIRAPEHDRRIGRGDDYAADGWRHTDTGQVIRVVVGYNPNTTKFADDSPTGPQPFPGEDPCPGGNDVPGPASTPDAGAAIFRQFSRDRRRFLDVLRSLDRDAWRPLAEAYCAYLMRVGCPAIDPSHVLCIWTKAVSGDIRLPARVHPLLERADASCESYMTARTERE